MAKGNRGFADILTGDFEEAPAENAPKLSEGIIASRSTALARLATGKVVTDRTEFIDPARCKPWRLHNRDLDHLTAESCADLIDAFHAAKRQRIPAIVRRLAGDPDFDYEIIAGVRRWWTVKWLRANHHPEFDFLVTVQKLTDEEAFRVSDVENRSRKDITDWERAQEYTKALVEFYDGAQSKMAEHLNISKSWLSRLIDVARLPQEIVEAFSDRHDITVRIARDLKPLSGDPHARARMHERSLALQEARNERGECFSGAEVAKQLIKAAIEPKPKAAPSAPFETRNSNSGKPMIEYARAGQGRVTLRVLSASGADRAEILQGIEDALDALGIFRSAKL
jgi:ParB family transcriptional regulator, chromosome partitioning protein